MRISFFNEKGNLEVRECDGVEVNAQNFDFQQEQGFVRVNVMFPKEDVTLEVTDPGVALDYIKNIDRSVETGVLKMSRDEARVIFRNKDMEKFNMELGCVMTERENVYTNNDRAKTADEQRKDEIDQLFK